MNTCIDFEFVDFRQTPIDRQTLQSFIDGVGWDKLINKRSHHSQSVLILTCVYLEIPSKINPTQ
jgi:arsenate reductase